jgi:hypothetical protein
MQITQNLGRSDTYALDLITGFVSTGSDWSEDIIIPGDLIASADTFDWQLNFRRCRKGSNDLSLSTDAGSLVISQGTSTTVQIRASRDDLSGLCGDYLTDLVYEDGSGNRIHQAHGVYTFVYEPIWV